MKIFLILFVLLYSKVVYAEECRIFTEITSGEFTTEIKPDYFGHCKTGIYRLNENQRIKTLTVLVSFLHGGGYEPVTIGDLPESLSYLRSYDTTEILKNPAFKSLLSKAMKEKGFPPSTEWYGIIYVKFETDGNIVMEQVMDNNG